MKNHLKHVSNT